MSNNNRARTPEQIEAELAATREEMSRAVDALVGQLQPSYQIEQAKKALAARAQTFSDDARTWLSDLGERITTTVEAARDGDTEALKKVGATAVGVLVLAGLFAFRFRKR